MCSDHTGQAGELEDGERIHCVCRLRPRLSHRVSKDAWGGREQQSSVARTGMGRTGETMRGLGKERKMEISGYGGWAGVEEGL